MKYMYLEPTL